MRKIAVSLGAAVALVAALWLNSFGQPPAAAHTGPTLGDTQVLSTLLPTGFQQIVVVDTRQQVMAVYHIEPAGGKIQLKSVRKLQMDLAIEQFNATEPLPSEMRLLK